MYGTKMISNYIDMASKTIVTTSKPTDFPSLLRQKLSTTQTVERHKVQTEALIQETCEKCGRKEVRFTSVQLRSADEGATNFYTCECGHKYVSPGNPMKEYDLLSSLFADGATTTERLCATRAALLPLFVCDGITRYPNPKTMTAFYSLFFGT